MKSLFEPYREEVLNCLQHNNLTDVDIAKQVMTSGGVLLDDEILTHYKDDYNAIREALRRYANRLRHQQPTVELNPLNTIVIPDIHEPFAHSDFMQFCINVRNKFACGSTIFLGDIVDSHTVSNWNSRSELPNSAEEFKQAINKLQEWHEEFPNAKVLLGNHDLRIARKMEDANIPLEIFKLDYPTIFKTPTWHYVNKYEHNGIIFIHGDGGSGQNRAYKLAQTYNKSVVIGHLHHECNLRWLDTNMAQFAAIVGCGIDGDSSAFAYGSKLARKLQRSVLVLLGNLPILIPFQVN